jgi:hypothetical protein
MSATVVEMPLPGLPEGDKSAEFQHRASRLRITAAELIEMAEECEKKISPEYRTLMRALYGDGNT